MLIQQIHQKALEAAGRFKRAEADLLAILQEVESARAFVKLGHTSLFSYCVQALGLSESVAFNFVTVARKAREVPALRSAIESGALSVSKARKITPVLNLENQAQWIERAITLPSRRLEEEVARVAPREASPERLKPVSEDRAELRLGISAAAQEKLRRAQDLESQRTSRATSLAETLEALLDLYLEARDPVRRAARAIHRRRNAYAPVPGQAQAAKPSAAVPASVKHAVHLRDGGRCTHRNQRGEHCENRRWIELHHVRPRSQGGGNRTENLVTLCEAHHRILHERDRKPSLAQPK